MTRNNLQYYACTRSNHVDVLLVDLENEKINSSEEVAAFYSSVGFPLCNFWAKFCTTVFIVVLVMTTSINPNKFNRPDFFLIFVTYT